MEFFHTGSSQTRALFHFTTRCGAPAFAEISVSLCMIVAEGDSHYYNFDMGTWKSCAECRLNLHAVLFCLYSIAVFENSRTSSSQGGRGEFETEKKTVVVLQRLS